MSMPSFVGRFNIILDTDVTINDVLLGRGASADRFEGNIKFRSLVRQHKDAYRAATHHHDKAATAQQIVNAVTAYQGRFLRKLEPFSVEQRAGEAPLRSTHEAPVWEVVNNAVALEKVKQALRDIDQVDSKANRKPTASRCKSTGSSEGASTPKTNFEIQARRSSDATEVQRRLSEPATSNGRQGDHQEETSLQAKKRAPRQGNSVSVSDIVHATETTPKQNKDSSMEHAAVSAAGQKRAAAEIQAHHDARIFMEQNQRSQGSAAPLALSRYMMDTAQQLAVHAQVPAAAAAAIPPIMPTGFALPPIPQSRALSEAFRNEVAYSWREIPGAYLDFLPLVREGRILPFSSEDLQILLLTLAWAESTRDLLCLAQIRTVIAAILALPQPQLRLTREEIDCLIHIMRGL
jgi:hypothetical protein